MLLSDSIPQSPFPAHSSVPTAVSRFPFSSHVPIYSYDRKHNIVLLCTDCSHAAILDNPWHRLSPHIQEPFTSVILSFYIALSVKVKLSVKTYITLLLCTFNFPQELSFFTVYKTPDCGHAASVICTMTYNITLFSSMTLNESYLFSCVLHFDLK